MKPLWDFKRTGQSGIPMSDLFPHVRTCVDDLCVIRSMVGEGVDHGAALLQTFTGTSTFTRPSLGSWALYGLGTENQNLPGYITIKPALAHGGAKNWSSAFLPGAYQGTAIGHSGLKVRDFRGEPIEYLFTAASRRSSSATSWTCSRTSIGATLNFASTMPSWRPASRPSNWRFECR